jgi:diguanylate cyclase (GGDEF)-like protein
VGEQANSSLHPAIARTTRWAVLLVLVVSVLAFSVAGERLANNLSVQLAGEQARLLAIAVTPTTGDNLSHAFERVCARTDRLIAVGVLDETGAIAAVYPDEIAFRAAVQASAREHRPLAASVEVDGEFQPAWIMHEAIPLADGSRRSCVLLLRRHPHLAGWALMSTSVAAGVVVLALGVVRLASSWFERRVVRPLRSLAGLAEGGAGTGIGNGSLAIGGWEETEKIARRLDELLTELEESRDRTARLERAKQWEMLKKEEGFNNLLRRVKTQATTDQLTQLRNRAFLDESLKTIVDHQQEAGEDLAFVMIDIDNFKHHNDTRGHAAGDEVLRFVGQLLRGAIRPSDHAVRYGGDEFTLLLPGTNQSQAKAVVERIIKMFAQYASRYSSARPLSMSAGVATLDEIGSGDVSALIAAADEALYTAKSLGKNTVATHALS